MSEPYIVLQDVRDEGIPVDELSDDRAEFLIEGWSRFIDRMTGNYFYENEAELLLDGNGTRVMHLPTPIVELTALYINDDFVNAVSTSDYTVYNREFPDDRKNPRVKMKNQEGSIFSSSSSRIFEVGDQNQKFVGKFGFLEPDGSVPFLIQRAVLVLVLATGELKSDSEIDQMKIGLKTEEVTDRHRVRFADLWKDLSAWSPTGFREVDEAIRLYRRPAYVGGARSF